MKIEGLSISGIVSGRTKKFVGENQTELVTYVVNADGKHYYVKDWKPDDKYFGIGESITVPVVVKIYQRNGQSSLDYSILRSNRVLGDMF